MDNQWILAMVRARCVRRVVVLAVVLASVVVLLVGQRRYIQNFVAGPYEIGEAELAAIDDVSRAPRYFIKVTGSDVIETGLKQITVRKRHGVETGRSVSAAYFLLTVGDKYLLCKSGETSGTTFEGELAPIPADIARRLFDTADMRAVRQQVYPFYLEDHSFRAAGYWAIAGLAVLALLVLTVGRRAWKHLRDPSAHPVIKRVGEWGDPVRLATAQQEANAPRFKGRNGWRVTEQYLARSTFFTFDLLRLSDLVWAYKKVTKHSVNFIPTGRTYEAVLVCYGGTATITGKEQRIDAILTYAAERAPWAVFGFSEDLQRHWRKDQNSFCAAVEKRRKDRAAAGEGAPAPRA
jgi:hypothetical protein